VQPVASFTISPRRPTVAAETHFVDRSHDPGGRGIAWRAWDFGDDASAVGAAATHRYVDPGTYEVTLTVATYDGRVGTESRSIDVGV
jgi:PKD repeat protein